MDKFFTSKFATATTKSVAVEDNIMIKSNPATAGSKVLAAFNAPFTATAISNIVAAGYNIVGGIKMAEFGIAERLLSCVDSTAVDVISGGVQYVLSNDFSGRLKKQAVAKGMYYLHPTYGSVSRFGLIPSFSSGDQIGVLTRDVEGAFTILSAMSGPDNNDSTMHDNAKYTISPVAGKIRAAMLDNGNAPKATAALAKCVEKSLKIDTYHQLAPIFAVLSSAEFCNNTNRYDGVKYGSRAKEYKNFNDIYLNTRTAGFGIDAKLKVVMGNIVLSQQNYLPLYHKSMQIRRILKGELDKIFAEYDVLIVPHDTGANLGIDEAGEYAIAPLTGLPSLTVGKGEYGYEIITRELCENKLLAFIKEVM